METHTVVYSEAIKTSILFPDTARQSTLVRFLKTPLPKIPQTDPVTPHRGASQ